MGCLSLWLDENAGAPPMCQTWTRLNGATNQILSGEGTFVGSISETSLSFSSPFFVDLSVTLIIQHPLTSFSERRRKNRLVPHPLFWEPPKKHRFDPLLAKTSVRRSEREILSRKTFCFVSEGRILAVPPVERKEGGRNA